MSSSRQKLEDLDLTKLQFQVISTSTLFSNGELQRERDKTLDLSCLSSLHSKNEDFIAGKVYVRYEMQTVFKKLLTKGCSKMLVLIGSPGVGKSLVCFLSAFHLAAKNGKKIVFIRWTLDNNPRVFVMLPGKNDHEVKVGHIEFNKIGRTLERVILSANAYGYEQDHDEWRLFIDGPKEKDIQDFKPIDCFLCTSGGYEMPSDAERNCVEIFPMSGWEERTFICALITLKKLSKTQAEDAYWTCGGRLRLAKDYVEDKTVALQWCNDIVADNSLNASEIAVKAKDSRTATNSKDRLRTIFRTSDDRTIQIVDSQFLLRALSDKLTVNQVRDAYNVAIALGLHGVQGTLYEEIIHNWFQKNLPGPLTSCYRNVSTSQLSGKASIGFLNAVNLYWVPSTPNFANIDAAWIVWIKQKQCLHCIQYTIDNTHGFNSTTFEVNFLAEVLKKFPNITEVRIYFVVPSGVTFSNPHVDFEYENISCKFEVASINVVNDDQIDTSAKASFPFLA